MLQVTFDYEIKGIPVQVVASCKSVIDDKYIDGLSLIFLNEDGHRLLITYDKDLFEDLENEALYLLCDSYFNAELNFSGLQ